MLDPATRGLLEKTIDEAKGGIPIIKRVKISNSMQLQDKEDFILGLAIGYVMGKFLTVFHLVYNRYPDKQEEKEALEVIRNRTIELKQSLITTG